MTDKPFVLFPGMIQPLRVARAYGYLVRDGDALYQPGGIQPICTVSLARKIVEGGWLEEHGHATSRQSRACEQQSEIVESKKTGSRGRGKDLGLRIFRTDSLLCNRQKQR
jgi:hypothetical protein